jgi:hypothetical protein
MHAKSEALKAALVGKAGEALVAAELLRKHIDVAYPAFDGGVDLIAYSEHNFERVVPIQVKARSKTCYTFQRSWFEGIQGLVLVQVWNVIATPQFYIFENLRDVEDALGPRHANTASWKERGVYNVTSPNEEQFKRMQPHLNRWDRIESKLIAKS